MMSNSMQMQSLRNTLLRELETLQRLLFKQGELCLIALFTAMGLTVAGLENRTVEPALYNAAAAAGGGIVLGFCARSLFRNRTFLLRWMSSLACLILALLLMGWFTRGFVGISPSALPRLRPDWGALLQVAAGGLSSMLALKARPWRLRRDPAAGSGEGIRRAYVHLANGGSAPRPKERIPVFERMRIRIRGWRNRARKEEVRLLGAEEHRCPYCLQPVDSRDPRGVVVCPICHTRHHKDCWAVTGTCQVPHYHA
jgi:ribosomal protein L37AE/L43A